MTVTVLNIIPPKQVESAQTSQYASPENVKTIIDKFTVTNTSVASVSFSCNLVVNGDSPSSSNLIIKTRAIAVGETYECPELIGQVLEPQGTISTLASAATSLTMSASGRQIS